VQINVQPQRIELAPCICLSSELAHLADYNFLWPTLAMWIGLSPTKEPNLIATLALDFRKTSFLVPHSLSQIFLL
jgi:hypothetical protein